MKRTLRRAGMITGLIFGLYASAEGELLLAIGASIVVMFLSLDASND